MKIKKFAAAATAIAVLAAVVPTAGTLSYAENIANAGGGESVDPGVENAPKLIVDGKEIDPDLISDAYYGPNADYSIKGNAAHTYKIEYKGSSVCSISFACEDSETGADYSSGKYFCKFSTTMPITLSCSEKVKIIPEDVYGGSPIGLAELSGDIASPDEYGYDYSLGSQTGNGSGSFAFWGPSRSSTQICTTVMNFKSESDGTLELTITAKNDSESSNAPVEIKDNTTNISVSAGKEVIPDGTVLTVTPGEVNETKAEYNICLMKDNKEIQPNGKVTVKIPVPEAIKDKTIYVYRVDGGKYYDMDAKIENGFVVFETDHFSEYLVTTEKHEDAAKPSTPGKNPATGIAGGMFGIMAIAGAFVIVSKKKR